MITFLTGRIGAAALAFVFQVVAVRYLVPDQYVAFGLLSAVAVVCTSIVSLGTQAIIPRFVSAGRLPENSSSALLLVWSIIGVRLTLLTSLSLVGCMVYALVAEPKSAPQFASSAWVIVAFAVSMALFADGEAVSQALGHQQISRAVAIAEPAARLFLLGALAWNKVNLPGVDLVLISAGTAATSACILVGWSVIRLRQQSQSVPQERFFRWLDVARTGLPAQFGSVSYLLTAPAVVRLVVAPFLTTTEMKALIFCQSLAGSFLKYSLGTIIIKFIEPLVNSWKFSGLPDADNRTRLTLSLLIKFELAFMGAVVLCTAFFGNVALLLLGGHDLSGYGFVLTTILFAAPLAIVVSCQQVACNYHSAPHLLYMPALLSPISLAFLFLLVPFWGLYAAVMLPLADAIARVAGLDHMLRRHGSAGIVDWKAISAIYAFPTLAVLAHYLWHLPDVPLSILLTVSSLVCYALILWLLRPLRSQESKLLLEHTPLWTKPLILTMTVGGTR